MWALHLTTNTKKMSSRDFLTLNASAKSMDSQDIYTLMPMPKGIWDPYTLMPMGV